MKRIIIMIDNKSNIKRYLAILAFVIIIINAYSASCQNRTVGITFKGQQNNNQGFGKDLRIYEKSYAVVIGINKYKNLPELNGAVNDADDVSKTLMSQGFIIDKILDSDATLSKIKETLGDVLPRKLKRDDRVLIYFAGHGVSTGTGDTSMGYLLPVEGDKDKLRSTGISMREIQDWFADYPSKHVMFVADACYSGLALSTRSVGLPQSVKDYLQQITSKPVRLAITAGGAGEEANEWRGHGLFTYFFLEALKGSGSADSNSDGILTSDEMIAFIKPQVSQTALSQYKRQQNPLIGRSGEGEFLFILQDKMKSNSPENPVAAKEITDTQNQPSASVKEEYDTKVDITKYDEINKEIENQEKQNELYQGKLKAAWNTIEKAINSQSVSSQKKIALLKSFKKDFPSNNPYMDKVEQRIEYEEINEEERTSGGNTKYITFPNLGEIANKISDEINKQNEQANRERLYQDKLKSEWVKIENTINNESEDPLKKIALLKAFKNNFPSNNPYMDKIEQNIRQEETKIKEQKNTPAIIASISKNSDKENEQSKKERLYKEKMQAEWLKIENKINSESEPPQHKIALLKTFKKDFPSNNPYMEKVDERIETEETNKKENEQNLIKIETEKQSDKKEFVPLPGL